MNPRARLRCAEAHVAAIRRMVEDDAPCPAVLMQIRAVQGSLRAVARILVADEVRRRVRNMGVGEASELRRELAGLLLSRGSRRQSRS
jgi:DNA-binding FrmR family transcriptional regulator